MPAIFVKREKRDFFYPKTFDFLFQKRSVFHSEKMWSSLNIAVPEFQKYKKIQLLIATFNLQLYQNQLFHRYFSKILLTFKKHLFKGTPLNCYFRSFQWIGFTREYLFLGKYYPREYLNVKIPDSKLLQGKYLVEGVLIY